MAAGDLHLTKANVRDFSDALALQKRKTYKKEGKKVDMVTLNMNNLGLNNIPIPQDLSVFVVQDFYFPSLFVGVFC